SALVCRHPFSRRRCFARSRSGSGGASSTPRHRSCRRMRTRGISGMSCGGGTAWTRTRRTIRGRSTNGSRRPRTRAAVRVVHQLRAISPLYRPDGVPADRRRAQHLLELCRRHVEVVIDAAVAEPRLQHPPLPVVADGCEAGGVARMDLQLVSTCCNLARSQTPSAFRLRSVETLREWEAVPLPAPRPRVEVE